MIKYAMIDGSGLFSQHRPCFLRVLHELYEDVSEGHDYFVTQRNLKDLYHELSDSGDLSPEFENDLRYCSDFLYKHKSDGIMFIDCFMQGEIDNILNF